MKRQRLARVHPRSPPFDLEAFHAHGGKLPDLRQVLPSATTEGDVTALFPCRPERFAREIQLAATPVRMVLLSCEAAGATYGLSQVDMVDPGKVPHTVPVVMPGVILTSSLIATWAGRGRPPSAIMSRIL